MATITINGNKQPNPFENLPECRTVMQGTESQLAVGPAGLVAMIRFHQLGNSDRGMHTASLDLVQAEKLRQELHRILVQAADIAREA